MSKITDVTGMVLKHMSEFMCDVFALLISLTSLFDNGNEN